MFLLPSEVSPGSIPYTQLVQVPGAYYASCYNLASGLRWCSDTNSDCYWFSIFTCFVKGGVVELLKTTCINLDLHPSIGLVV